MQQYTVEITDEALADMEQIYNHIAYVLLAPENAMGQYNRIADEILKLDVFPERFRIMDSEPEHSKGIHRMLVDNYSVFYVIKDDIVPVFSSDFQNKIKGLILEMYELVNRSKLLYEDAKGKLIKILGLSNFKAEDKMYNIKSFSDSFGKTGRLDAEYYQPYYDEFEDIVKKHGFVLASDICEMINYGTVPTSPYTEDGTGTPYIKGMNVKNTEVDNEELDRIINTELLPNKFFTKQGDIIISQMGTVADCGVVDETQEGWLFASFTIRLRLKKNAGFNPHFVGLYIQELAKKYYFYKNIAQASVRQNTDLPTVNNLYIPKICIDTQNEIANMLIKCKYLKQESKDKLNNSIRAVEIAVESGEKAALDFLADL